MKKIWAWIILSSKDPQSASLTVKSILTGGVVYVVFFTGLFHYSVTASQLTQIIDEVGNVVGFVLMAISALATLVGFVRKLFTTATGTNAVINTGVVLG